MTAWVAKEIVQIPVILRLSTGATSGHRARLVNRSWWFHLHIFDDEKRNNVSEEVLVVLRYKRDTVLLQDLAQGLEKS